jgi:putative transposase
LILHLAAPEWRNCFWSYDFVETQTNAGRKLKPMTPIDEFTREYVAILAAMRIDGGGILETMADVMLVCRGPEPRSDKGPEMPPKIVQSWL